MRVGVEIAQGWKDEYAGWEAAAAWQRTVELARHAEALGFESLWVADHLHTRTVAPDGITFESFLTLAGLAPVTRTVRLGHIVVCAGYRNPALVAKMAATLDVISGGRYELGLGAGWKEDEWRAYGYGFPPLADRLAGLEEALEIVTRMLRPGRAEYEGRQWRIDGPINEPRGLQSPRIPVIVGGNGRLVTRRLAARFADELNLFHFTPDALREELALTRQRCEEQGRDPASLRVSMFWDERNHLLGRQERVDQLAAYAELGLDRLIAFPCLHGTGPEPQEQFADDCRAAGIVMAATAAV